MERFHYIKFEVRTTKEKWCYAYPIDERFDMKIEKLAKMLGKKRDDIHLLSEGSGCTYQPGLRKVA